MPRVLALALFLLLAGCGDAQTRPHVIGTAPGFGDVVDQPVELIHIQYDTPVTILSPAQLNVKLDGFDVLMWVWVDSEDPTRVSARAQSDDPLGPGIVAVAVAQGLVVNQAGHYSLDQYQFGFVVNPPADPALLAELPAKPSAEVIAVRPAPSTGHPRVWLQLADGRGTGEALVAWDRLAATLAPVALSFGAGGGLTSRAPALAVSPDGARVWAAYRDEAEGRVRISRVNGRLAVEEDSRVLSAQASPSTHPIALVLNADGSRVRVHCETASGRTTLELDADSLEELPLSGL